MHTKNEEEDGHMFRIPTWRNVALTAPYFHNGSAGTLRQVVEFYNRGGNVDAPNKAGQIKPLNLSEQDKDDLVAGTVHLAPADYHTLIEVEGTLGLSTEERVHFARPSIDVLFRTAAEAYRERCVGIVLTGANDDGADGLRRIKELGGVAIVQDPGTAERREMPAAAIAATDADVVLPLGKIGTFLRGLLLETRTRNPA